MISDTSPPTITYSSKPLKIPPFKANADHRRVKYNDNPPVHAHDARRGSPDQTAVWMDSLTDSDVQALIQARLNNAGPTPGGVFVLKHADSEYRLVGTIPEMIPEVKRPRWDRNGEAQPKDVDHIVEFQVPAGTAGPGVGQRGRYGEEHGIARQRRPTSTQALRSARKSSGQRPRPSPPITAPPAPATPAGGGAHRPRTSPPPTRRPPPDLPAVEPPQRGLSGQRRTHRPSPISRSTTTCSGRWHRSRRRGPRRAQSGIELLELGGDQTGQAPGEVLSRYEPRRKRELGHFPVLAAAGCQRWHSTPAASRSRHTRMRPAPRVGSTRSRSPATTRTDPGTHADERDRRDRLRRHRSRAQVGIGDRYRFFWTQSPQHVAITPIAGVPNAGYLDRNGLQNMWRAVQVRGMSPLDSPIFDIDPASRFPGPRPAVLPSLPIFENLGIDLVVDGKNVYLAKLFDIGDFKLPGPIKITRSSVLLTAGTKASPRPASWPSGSRRSAMASSPPASIRSTGSRSRARSRSTRQLFDPPSRSTWATSTASSVRTASSRSAGTESGASRPPRSPQATSKAC